MMGFTEDLVEAIARWIIRIWEGRKDDPYWIADEFYTFPMKPTADDLRKYLHDHADDCHEGVRRVFEIIIKESEEGVEI